MKVECLGYYDKEKDNWVNCNCNSKVKSYEQVHGNPNWMEFSPAQRLIDGDLVIFSQCIVCAEMEEESLLRYLKKHITPPNDTIIIKNGKYYQGIMTDFGLYGKHEFVP